jgi:hypothetical protein
LTSSLTCAIFGSATGMHQPMDDEYLTKCVVDPVKRTFYLYSSEGQEKSIKCDSVEEFMGVLKVVRATCPEQRLSYTNPII